MREKIEYYIIKFILFLSKILPTNTTYNTMKFVSEKFYKYGKRRSSLTIKNLTKAFPDKNTEEIAELAKKSYESVAITLSEIILLLNDKLNLDDMIENGEDFLQKLENYTKDTTSGTVVVTAHFSNWELAAQFLPLHGYPIVAIGREGNNKLIEKNITTPFRQRYGNRNIYKKSALLGIIKALKKNQIVGLLFDQKAGGRNSVKVNFFGIPADTTKSIAKMKLKLNPKIIPIFFPRNKNGKYTPIIYEPVEYTADEESDKEIKIQKMTQRYNDILEEVIREYPEQWFWMHNRWRLV